MMDFLRIEQGEGRMLEDAFDNGYIASIATRDVHANGSVISSDGIEYLTSRFEFIFGVISNSPWLLRKIKKILQLYSNLDEMDSNSLWTLYLEKQKCYYLTTPSRLEPGSNIFESFMSTFF